MAACTMIAFSKLSKVTIRRAVIPSKANSAARFPAHLATSFNSPQVAGISALPGSISPSASAIICMVEAVPAKRAGSARRAGMMLIVGELFLADLPPFEHGAVFADLLQSQKFRSGSITPPVTTMEGMSMRPMATSWAGTDLSQLDRNTPASKVVAFA